MKDEVWRQYVKGLIKAEMARNGVKYDQLVNKLRAIGLDTSRSNLVTKINRGNFSAKLLVQIFKALGSEKINLE